MNFYFIDPKKLNPIEGHSKERVNLLSEKLFQKAIGLNQFLLLKKII